MLERIAADLEVDRAPEGSPSWPRTVLHTERLAVFIAIAPSYRHPTPRLLPRSRLFVDRLRLTHRPPVVICAATAGREMRRMSFPEGTVAGSAVG
ncbi:hypothetical protein KRM28CT15_27750 [Krasilnikovia sp. M28-CT-15]